MAWRMEITFPCRRTDHLQAAYEIFHCRAGFKIDAIYRLVPRIELRLLNDLRAAAAAGECIRLRDLELRHDVDRETAMQDGSRLQRDVAVSSVKIQQGNASAHLVVHLRVHVVTLFRRQWCYGYGGAEPRAKGMGQVACELLIQCAQRSQRVRRNHACALKLNGAVSTGSCSVSSSADMGCYFHRVLCGCLFRTQVCHGRTQTHYCS